MIIIVITIILLLLLSFGLGLFSLHVKLNLQASYLRWFKNLLFTFVLPFVQSSDFLSSCDEVLRTINQSLSKSINTVRLIDLRFESPLNSLKGLHRLKQVKEM